MIFQYATTTNNVNQLMEKTTKLSAQVEQLSDYKTRTTVLETQFSSINDTLKKIDSSISMLVQSYSASTGKTLDGRK